MNLRVISQHALRFLIIFLATITVCTSCFQAVHAQPGDWFSAETMVSATEADYSHPQCTDRQVEHYVDQPWLNNGNPTTTDSLCVTEGKDVDVAMGQSRTMYVKYHTDAVFRLLLSGYGVLTEGTNVFTTVTEDFQNTLSVVKDLSTALEARSVGSAGQDAAYAITPALLEPQLPRANEPGRYHTVVSYKVSANSRYIVAYIDYTGVVKIDLETGAVTKVLQPGGADRDYPYNPSIQAISDDGRFVLVGNAVTIVDTKDCGESFTGPFDRYVQMQSPCPSKSFATDVSPLVGYAYHVNDARFFNEGYGLEFRTTLDGRADPAAPTSPKHIVLNAAGYVQVPQLEYLALGDSFSSGEGDIVRDDKTNLKAYREYTDSDGLAIVNGVITQVRPREKCHLSTNSYPYRLATGMDLALATKLSDVSLWQSVACAGATIKDINSQDAEEYKGQNDNNKPRLKEYDVTTLKSQALNEFIPGRQKQIEFVKKYQPKVITLTVGGNDIDFGGKMMQCVSGYTTCDYATESWRAKLKNEIYDQFANLKSLYAELRSATNGQSKIYVLGYPIYINADPTAACSVKSLFLNLDERVMIVNSILYLNNIIKAAAENAGVTYIDIENAFGNHRLCDTGEAHMNAVVGLLGYRNNEEQESFHPNREGQSDIARAIWDDVDGQSLLDYITCPRDPTQKVCPDATKTAADAVVPPYFTTENDDNTTVRYYTLTNGTLIKSVEYYDVDAGQYRFEPESKVDITLYSDPTRLGKFDVDSEGRLNAVIKIPSGVPPGYHRLSITGTSSDGKPIELYQTVLVRGSDTNDVDEDGIPDKSDTCIYGIVLGDNQDTSTSPGCAMWADSLTSTVASGIETTEELEVDPTNIFGVNQSGRIASSNTQDNAYAYRQSVDNFVASNINKSSTSDNTKLSHRYEAVTVIMTAVVVLCLISLIVLHLIRYKKNNFRQY